MKSAACLWAAPPASLLCPTYRWRVRVWGDGEWDSKAIFPFAFYIRTWQKAVLFLPRDLAVPVIGAPWPPLQSALGTSKCSVLSGHGFYFPASGTQVNSAISGLGLLNGRKPPLYFCFGDTSVGAEGPHVVLRVEPRLAMCRVNALPPVLLAPTQKTPFCKISL